MTLPDLRTAARPFVSRALRGGRGRRLAGLSLLLALLSSVSGLWLALGSGDFEREIREALDLEVSRYRRERIEFVLIVESAGEAAEIRNSLAQGRYRADRDWTVEADYRARSAVEEGAQSLYSAAFSDAPRGSEGLRQEAVVAWQRWARSNDTSNISSYGQQTYFNWYDEEAVRGLRAVIASDGVPRVEVYASPLGPIDAFRLAGAIAGGVLVILLMLAAPVLAGTQMAQETHENTLQPLAGSALRSTELTLGLTAGPLAVAALLAAPQLLLLFAAAATVGHLGPALALVAVAATGGAFLVMLAQLAGLALGKLRSPGLVGGGLAAVLGLLGGVGLVFAGELRESAVGVLALLPQAAASHALAQTFDLGRAGIGFGAPVDTTVPVTIGAFGMIAFAVLGMRALARRIGQTTLSALGACEALVGATVAMLLVSCANPPRHYHHHDPFYLINLGLLIVPFAILLMMRAPLGDLPANLRRTPVGRLVGEFTGWAGLYLVGSALLFGTTNLHVLTSPVAALYLGWFVVVAALLSLRIAAAPMTFASRVWAALCAVAVTVAFAQAGMWARSLDDLAFRSPPLFVLSELSPVLGALQAILLVVIPWTLLRALTRPAPAPA